MSASSASLELLAKCSLDGHSVVQLAVTRPDSSQWRILGQVSVCSCEGELRQLSCCSTFVTGTAIVLGAAPTLVFVCCGPDSNVCLLCKNFPQCNYTLEFTSCYLVRVCTCKFQFYGTNN